MTSLLFPKGMQLADTIASMRTLGESGACVRRVFVISHDDKNIISFDRLLVANEKETDKAKTLTMYVGDGFSDIMGELLAVSLQSVIDGLGSKRGRVMAMAAFLTVNAHEKLQETWEAFGNSESLLCVGFDDTNSRPMTFELPEPSWKLDKDGQKIGFGKLSKESTRYSAWVLPLAFVVSYVNAMGQTIAHAETLTPKTPETVKAKETVKVDIDMTGLI